MTGKWRCALIGAAMMSVSAIFAAPAFALSQEQINGCVNNDGSVSKDTQIADCTAAIGSGQWSGKNLSWAYGNRCVAYKDEAKYDIAMPDCNQALALDPTNAFAYNDRGAIYYLKNDYDDAITDYSKAIQYNPKFVDAYHNRGMAYAAKGDLDTAIADYNHALQLDPNDALALYERGVAKQKKGDPDGGNADIAAAKKINPKIGG